MLSRWLRPRSHAERLSILGALQNSNTTIRRQSAATPAEATDTRSTAVEVSSYGKMSAAIDAAVLENYQKVTRLLSEGVKFDADKAPVVRGNLHYFPRAHVAVAMISAYGAKKYSVQYEDKNWSRVPDGLGRYTDGDGRHLLGEGIDGRYDPESHYLHAAHHAWNALARLEKLLEEGVPLRDPEHDNGT